LEKTGCWRLPDIKDLEHGGAGGDDLDNVPLHDGGEHLKLQLSGQT